MRFLPLSQNDIVKANDGQLVDRKARGAVSPTGAIVSGYDRFAAPNQTAARRHMIVFNSFSRRHLLAALGLDFNVG